MNDSSAHHEEFASAKQPRPNHPNNKDEIVNESIIPTELNSDKDNASLIGTVGSKSNVVKKVSGGMYAIFIHSHMMYALLHTRI